MTQLPEALRLAREVRNGEAQHGPHVLYRAAGDDKDLYRHAMVEAGYVAQDLPQGEPFRANDPCPYCGHEFGNTNIATQLASVAVSEEEARCATDELIAVYGGVAREQYDAMMAARDHCKQQATAAGRRLVKAQAREVALAKAGEELVEAVKVVIGMAAQMPGYDRAARAIEAWDALMGVDPSRAGVVGVVGQSEATP